MIFDSTVMIGWRLYESFTVGETESSSKDYSSLILAEYSLIAIVRPTVLLGGGHTVSVSGKVVSWTYFTMAIVGPTNQNAPSVISVFYR